MSFTINTETIKWSRKVLDILLFDFTTKQNIIWSTDNYAYLGHGYQFNDQITYDNIITINNDVIFPRVLKTEENQYSRTKNRAEVFTPSWICNLQNNIADEIWFEQKDVFNIVDPSNPQIWKANNHKIEFSKIKKSQKTWQDYVLAKQLEITCGEAPYLVSRYDTVTGKNIPIIDRIGLLDRKLRIIIENTETDLDWIHWTIKAFQSVYGFEYHGDSLLIARENLLASFYEYTKYKLNREPTESELIKIATIISWNTWQMDGLTYASPYKSPIPVISPRLFVEMNDEVILYSNSNNNSSSYYDYLCIVKDWNKNKIYLFKDLMKNL